MSTKRERALNEYNGHKGMATVAHVERNIEQAYPTAWQDLTGVQYGRVMSVANTSYHAGKSAAGAWADSGLVGFDDVSLPEELLRAISQRERTEKDSEGNTWSIVDYYIDELLIYTERF